MADKDFTLDIAYLNSIFEYKDGNLIYKIKIGNRQLNDIVGGFDSKGYIRTKIKKTYFQIHRIIFYMHHNYLPKYIDHIDGNRSNNKIENLRPATMAENNRNRKLSSRNKSGVKGVNWSKNQKKWKAQCTINYKQFHIGYFNNLNDAKLSLNEFRKNHHGEFSNNG